MTKNPLESQVISAEPKQPKPIPGFEDFGHIALEGIGNARDLGGLPAAEGGTIAEGRLLRSGDLHGATTGDAAVLTKDHDLSYICDLRTPVEVRHSPDAMDILEAVDYVHLSALPEDAVMAAGFEKLSNDLHLGREFMEDPLALVGGLYPTCLKGSHGQVAYRRLLHDLLKRPIGATLWHCTQGKDRTGIAAILVEHALGVPEEYIRQDYLATNLFMGDFIQRLQQLLEKFGVAKHLDLDLEAYIYAHPAYYDRAMETIRSDYGTLDDYLEQALDFGPAECRRLREMYLD